MKNKVKTFSVEVLIITFLFYCGGQMSGQEKISVSAGIGYPELINAGIKYQALDQARIGLSIGWFPPFDSGYLDFNNTLSFSGDFYFHFAGSSKYSDLRPWYGRVGFNIILELQQPSDVDPIDCLDSYIRIGRDLYIDKNSGISLDAGIGCNFYTETYFFPALGVCYFYRF
jgi:hypothetical protein